jgi:hypothetical protein
MELNGANEMSISLEAERSQSNELAEVRAECARLKEVLAQIELERNYYRKGFIDYERQYGEFRDVDVADLEKNSAGPVELL